MKQYLNLYRRGNFKSKKNYGLYVTNTGPLIIPYTNTFLHTFWSITVAVLYIKVFLTIDVRAFVNINTMADNQENCSSQISILYYEVGYGAL